MVVEKETIVERRGGSGLAIALLAVAIIAAVVLGFMFLQNDTKQTDAVSGAAQSVGQAADTVTDTVKPTEK